MHDVLKKRILRKLEVLPEAQLYQVLDYIEFLESRYAERQAPSATGFQRFAERLEDEMRARSLAARTMSGTMKLVSTAGKVIDGISGIFEPPPPRRESRGSRDLPARRSDSPQSVVGSIGGEQSERLRPPAADATTAPPDPAPGRAADEPDGGA